jgi:hypothetical protein
MRAALPPVSIMPPEIRRPPAKTRAKEPGACVVGEAIPDVVKRVASQLGWGIGTVETHPNGQTIVAVHGYAGGADDHGGLFEVNLKAFHAMDTALRRRNRRGIW